MSDSMQVVLTPTVARFARRSLLWVAISLIVLVIALIGFAVGSLGQNSNAMAADNPAPNGAQALVEVLRHEGVTVIVADSLEEATDAADDPENTTLFLYDASFYLDPQQTETALDLAETVVVLQPSYTTLELISSDLALAGFTSGTRDADCSVPAAEAAEEITTSGEGYRILGGDAEGCFADDDVFSLVQLDGVTALGTESALSNGAILEQGNAALALNLLGANDTLVWYLPTAADYDSEIATASELSPPWVLPVTLTLFLVGLAAILWRGRRLGPLIVENLPVTVKASETMQGRARLYERANARLHTLDSLRIGAIARLATLCGLPVLATVDEVIAASAAIASMDPAAVRHLLVEAQPASDRDLVRLSDELLVLEQTVTHRLRPH